jgi:hypothetical protein
MSKVDRTKIFYGRNLETGEVEDENLTLDYKWNQQNRDRLIMWETFKRHVKHESKVPMTNIELCDKIGSSRTHLASMLQLIKNRLNAEQ